MYQVTACRCYSISRASKPTRATLLKKAPLKATAISETHWGAPVTVWASPLFFGTLVLAPFLKPLVAILHVRGVFRYFSVFSVIFRYTFLGGSNLRLVSGFLVPTGENPFQALLLGGLTPYANRMVMRRSSAEATHVLSCQKHVTKIPTRKAWFNPWVASPSGLMCSKNGVQHHRPMG